MYKRTLAGFGNDYPIGTISAGELPNIKGVYRVDYGRPTSYTEGAFYNVGGGPEIRGNTAAGSCGIGFDASRSVSIYGEWGGVLPRSLFVKFVIKY